MSVSRVLFTPLVAVLVDDAGSVVGVEVDWSDSFCNLTGESGATTEGVEAEQHPAGVAACAHLDGAELRTRVAEALQAFPGALAGGAL